MQASCRGRHKTTARRCGTPPGNENISYLDIRPLVRIRSSVPEYPEICPTSARGRVKTGIEREGGTTDRYLAEGKKAPSTFQSRTPRQPSPRTAKPQLDSRAQLIRCKCHFSNCFRCQMGYDGNLQDPRKPCRDKGFAAVSYPTGNALMR